MRGASTLAVPDLGILNGDGASCFGSTGCTDSEPTGFSQSYWSGWTKPFLVGEDLDAEGASLPVIMTWSSIDISQCTGSISFSGDFGARTYRPRAFLPRARAPSGDAQVARAGTQIHRRCARTKALVLTIRAVARRPLSDKQRGGEQAVSQ